MQRADAGDTNEEPPGAVMPGDDDTSREDTAGEETSGEDPARDDTSDDGTTEDAAPARGWDRYDAAIVCAAAIATVFVHPVRFALRHPFWLDESWVAVLTKAPLGRLPRLSSSAPLGFVTLLKLVPGTGLQRGRLVVLAFSVLTVVTAYVLARSLGWKPRWLARVAATVTALVVMLAPLSLIRNDLKQYTCDAFCALALLALGARAERAPTRSSLVWLTIAAVVSAPFSSTALFVAVAVFAGLLASAGLARAGRRAVEILVAGLVTGAVLAAYVVVAVAPNLNAKLKTYWASQYLSGSIPHMLHVSWNRLVRLGPDLAMPAWLFAALFVLGVVVLVRLRAYTLAIAIPLLWFEMALMGRLERYPFLDLRTAHFLLVSSLVVVALGAVGIVETVRRLSAALVGRFGSATVGARVGWGAAAAVGATMAVLFAAGFHQYLDQLHIPAEDVRSETYAVAAQLGDHDVVVLSVSANFGFSYYWPHGRVTFRDNASGQGFGPEVAGLDAIWVPARTPVGILAGMREAVDRWRAAGTGSRLFIVRTHLSPGEVTSWQAAFDELGVVPKVVRVGSDPLLVIEPPAP